MSEPGAGGGQLGVVDRAVPTPVRSAEGSARWCAPTGSAGA
ncbi:MAG TPA: hypothetical protein VF486_15710 [Actinomycetes bacterium]